MNHNKRKNKQIQNFKLSELGQFDRAVTADPTLWKLVHNDRTTAHAATVARLTPAVTAGLPDPGQTVLFLRSCSVICVSLTKVKGPHW
jgi:hypothetical protein